MKISKKVNKVLCEFSATQRIKGACPEGTSARAVIDFFADVVHNNLVMTKKQLRMSVGLCPKHGNHWAQDCDDNKVRVRVNNY